MIQSGDMLAVSSFIARMGKEIEALIKSALEISWYSRGGWQYETVLNMSQAEREMAVEFINAHLDSIKTSPFPVY